MNLNIREIEYILTIMEEGSITKASQKLFIAQPSLSQVLKRVENDLASPCSPASKTALS